MMASSFYEQIAQLCAATEKREWSQRGIPDDTLRALHLASEYAQAAELYAAMCSIPPEDVSALSREGYRDALADVAIMAIVAIQGMTSSSSKTEGIVRRRMDYHVRRIS